MTRNEWPCAVQWKTIAFMSMLTFTAASRIWAAALTPYGGSPVAIPGTVQPANFDNGGEGVAYHDTTPGNTGGAYRSTDVDLQAGSEGGVNVGWIAAGEWINYTVSVASAGSYTAQLRVASPSGGGMLHIGFNGPSNVWKTMSIPGTGDWQTWTTVSVPVTLGAGVQQLTLLFDAPGFNLGPITVTAAGGSSGGGLSPFSGTAAPVPGLIQAGNFDNGGEGVAYHDTTPENSGGAYRSTGVDIERSSDGGFDVGWVAAGEWLNYTINAAAGGAYSVQLRVASPSGGALHVGFNGPSNVWTTVPIPSTGGWQNWTTVSLPAQLGAGRQQMTIFFDTAGVNFESASVTSSTQVGLPPPVTGAIRTVNAGGDLQAALQAAQPGDTIVLQAGATFTGNFILPAKSASATAYVTITTSAAPSSLPPANTRIDPRYSSLLPKLRSPNTAPALATAPFAHHYELRLLEFLANAQGQGDIIDFGDGSSAQNTTAMVPHDLIADRLYIHGDSTYGQKRGIGLNSASTTIVNSYVSGIAAVEQDSQTICGWNGPGPFTIVNNYLEGAGENLLFGGSDPAIPELVPSDISIKQNYFTKQTAWMGQHWQVKNILEFKNAQRVTVDGNVLEYNWAAAQTGYSVLFTPRNQDGTAPWSVVQQIQFTNNIVRHVSSAINILGTDDQHTSQPTNGIVIRNNLFEDVSSAKYGGDGRFILINGGTGVTIDHNTVFEDGTSDLFADGPSTGFAFTNNIMPNNTYGVIGSNTSPGRGTITSYFPGSEFFDNVIAGAILSVYPAGLFAPPTMSAVGFVNLGGGNYRLSPASLYRNAATDGTDVGANIDAINAAAGTTY